MSPFVTTLAEGMIYLTLLVYCIATLIYGYHWFNYGVNKKTSTTAMIIFLAGAAVMGLGLVITFINF